MTNEKKIAIVTGASRGIGAQIFYQLGQAGYFVIGTATTEEGANTLTAKLASEGFEGIGLSLDISNEKAIQSFLELLKEKGWLPDILVNNAGITRDNLFMRMSEQEWSDVIDTNLSGVFRLTKGVIRSMMKNRWGRVINVGSVVASTGNPGQVNYCAAKAGLIGFSKALALEVATRGVTVNVIAPGFIQTDMTNILSDEVKEKLLVAIPMQKVGKPEDIASMVCFLASEQANYITGQTIHINGGLYLS